MLRILIIEDDEDHAFLEQDVLEDEIDCQVTLLTSKKEVNEVSLEDFDIVLLDFNLPDSNGDDVLRFIRKSSQIPVIMITGDDHLQTAVQTLKDGANDFIVKSPHTLSILPRIVNRVFDEYQSKQLLTQKEKEKDNLNIKVETLRQVLTTLAHYINNSTTTIFGYAQLCEQNPGNADRCAKLAKIGIKETQKITFVIRELESFVNTMEIKTTDYVNIPDAMFEIEENIKRKMTELEKKD